MTASFFSSLRLPNGPSLPPKSNSTNPTAGRRASFLPPAGKTFLLGISLAVCFIMSTAGTKAQVGDDHGDTFGAATGISLGSSIAGRIDHGQDRDVFRLDLTGASGLTNVWIYTTGAVDTIGWLYDRSSNLRGFNDEITSRHDTNYHLRAVLPRGIYYIATRSFEGATGDYYLHAQESSEPGNSRSTATNLPYDTPTPGTINYSSDADYFRLEFSRFTNVGIFAKSSNFGPVDVVVLDDEGAEIDVNVGSLATLVNSRLVWDGFGIQDGFGPGTYYLKITTARSFTRLPVPYAILHFEDDAYTEFVEDCEAKTRSLDDPLVRDSLYACQWHLDDSNGHDINVQDVWAEGIKGQGVNIAVVDSGMDYTHEDLVENVDVSRNHDYTGRRDINYRYSHHGTRLAGVMAARDNDFGVRGIAPRANLYGYNYLRATSDLNLLDAMTRHGATTAVSNNSWGPIDGPGLSPAPATWETAIENGIERGYDGKGTFFVFSGGNGHLTGDISNFDEYANFYGVTAVCAVNDHGARSSYSETGANLWVCGPSNDPGEGHRGILTTENSDRYYERFGGTSAAAPMVSGAAALMRSANPNLSWRDLKLILAASARKNDPENTGWEVGALKKGSDSDRYNFNHEYGFGVVDAKAAVDLAKGWYGLPPLRNSSAGSNQVNLRVPDPHATDGPGSVSSVVSKIQLNTGIEFTEFVEVNVSMRHNSFRDLEVELVSPSGAVSILAPDHEHTVEEGESESRVRLNGDFRFGSARHLGEDPRGEWQLRVTDRVPGFSGTLVSWGITVYGHTGVLDCETGRAVPDVSDNPGLVSDCKTMLDARYALAGTGKLNWSASTPIENWDGVTIGGTPPRVTELNLYGREMTGSIPGELANLTRLRVLLLSSNQLTGTIPVSLATLSNLEALDLRDNNLTGSLPVEMAGLSGLRSLSVGDNGLTGQVPTWLGGLTNLLSLSLEGNGLSGPIPVELAALVNLRTLSLAGNSLTGGIPMDLESLTYLKELYLSDNQLTGTVPAWIDGLSDLYVLSLADNRLTGPMPAELGNLPNLTTLDLSGNRLTGAIPAGIGDLSNLRRLYLSDNLLDGCIPQGLRIADETDLGEVGLPYCDVLLSSLAVAPGSLTPPFDPYETEYTAIVPSRVTVTSANEHNAATNYLNEYGRQATDADRSLAGHQVDLGPGINTLKVEVTSQDGQASLTYTIVMSREDLPGAPEISAVTAGFESLTVTWTPPARTGGVGITSYDLRHVESDATDKADSRWTLVDDAWTGGPLTYTVTGLSGNVEYDIQVRAVSASGDGLWSETRSARTIASADVPVFADGPTATRSIADSSVVGADVGTPVSADDAAGSELAYTLGGADASLFTIDAKTGQIKLGAGTALDYESEPYTFTVEVTATGPSGAAAAITVTIAVIDARLGALGSRYDANRDRKIERDEVVAAIVDYFADVISREDVVRIITLYFTS